MNELRAHNGLPVIAFDGKTLRHSFDGDRKSALHSVSAYAVEQGLVLAQSRSKGKKNEVATVMELIALLSLKHSIVTADAMSCLKMVATALTKKGAHYVLQVKLNQKRLLHEIEAFFHKQRRDEPETVKAGQYTEIDSGHGRIESRHYTQLAVTDWLSQGKGWKGLTSVIEVTRERHCQGKMSTETSYYISSLEVNPEQVAYAIRNHWRIENSSHWVLDVTFREDDSRIRRGDAPENMATFRRFAMNLARLSPIKDSIRGKLKQAAWSDKVREELLFG